MLFVLLPALGEAADAAASGGPISDGRELLLVLAPAGASAALLINIGLAMFKPAWPLRAAGRVRVEQRVQ